MKIKLGLFTLIFLLIFLSSFVQATNPPFPQPVEYEIFSYWAKAENCSIQFTNLENNQKKDAYCENCRCIQDLANIGAKEGDLISALICVHENAFCLTDEFQLEGKPMKREFNIDPCVPKYDVIFEFTSLKRENPKIESKEIDILNLKEDDILKLNKLHINKVGDCEMEGWIINFNLVKPNGEVTDPFDLENVLVPSLNQGQTYSLVFENEFSEKIGNDQYHYYDYITYIDGKPFKSISIRGGTQQLFYVGGWSINAWLSRNRYSNFFGEGKYKQKVHFRDINKEDLAEPTFKVKPKSEHEVVDYSKSMENLTSVLLILTFILIIPALIEFNKLIKKIYKKEKDSNYAALVALWVIVLSLGMMVVLFFKSLVGYLLIVFLAMLLIILQHTKFFKRVFKKRKSKKKDSS